MADPKQLAKVLSSYQPDQNDTSMQIVNGRTVIYDKAGNVAAYENPVGTLVPGPAYTAGPFWEPDAENMARARTQLRPTNSPLAPDDLPGYGK